MILYQGNKKDTSTKQKNKIKVDVQIAKKEK